VKNAVSRSSGGAKLFGLAAALMVTAAVPLVAFAHGSAKVVGSPKAGKPLFVSTCGVCHTLRAGGTTGAVGPNLDRVSLSEAVIIRAITYGGATVMSKSALGKYSTQMVPYKGALTPEQITNIAAYVYVSTHK
jgi:mono/diheme cytochrome c family protein